MICSNQIFIVSFTLTYWCEIAGAENYKENKEIQLYRLLLIRSFSFALETIYNIDFNLKFDAAKRNCRNVQCTQPIRYFDFLLPVVDKTFFTLIWLQFFIFQCNNNEALYYQDCRSVLWVVDPWGFCCKNCCWYVSTLNYYIFWIKWRQELVAPLTQEKLWILHLKGRL